MKFPTAAPPAELVWFPEYGMGYYPVPDGFGVYDAEYWAKYERYDATDMGKALTAARVAMVRRWWDGKTVVDVGIGAGAFIQAMEETAPTWGFDVNPVAIEWLRSRNQFADPTQSLPSYLGGASGPAPHALTFWDCLEHIKEPDRMLSKADAVFASLPIFTGPEHVLKSHHFRKDEHCWYWTREGFIQWMGKRGFYCVEHSTVETLLGRADIGSFAFLRVSNE